MIVQTGNDSVVLTDFPQYRQGAYRLGQLLVVGCAAADALGLNRDLADAGLQQVRKLVRGIIDVVLTGPVEVKVEADGLEITIGGYRLELLDVVLENVDERLYAGEIREPDLPEILAGLAELQLRLDTPWPRRSCTFSYRLLRCPAAVRIRWARNRRVVLNLDALTSITVGTA